MDAKHKKHFDVFWSLIHKTKKNWVCNFHVWSKLLGPSFRNAKHSVTQVTVTIKICSSCKLLGSRVHLRWHCGSTKWKKNFYEIVIFSFFERKESLGYQLKKIQINNVIPRTGGVTWLRFRHHVIGEDDEISFGVSVWVHFIQREIISLLGLFVAQMFMLYSWQCHLI